MRSLPSRSQQATTVTAVRPWSFFWTWALRPPFYPEETAELDVDCSQRPENFTPALVRQLWVIQFRGSPPFRSGSLGFSTDQRRLVVGAENGSRRTNFYHHDVR